MTVAELLASKGQRQLTMLYAETVEDAAAAAEAGIDMLSIIQPVWNAEMRAAAGNCFVQVGLLYGELCTTEDYLRAAHAAIRIGGDACYCAASFDTVRALAAEGIPVVGHVGLVPSKATWTGGFRAVGTTAAQARRIYADVKSLEAAGAIGAEMEVVPERVATEISRRTPLMMLSMGSGDGCDAQYLFSEDVLGCTRGRRPRHAKAYRDFAAEFARLHGERVNAFREFASDVATGAFPTPPHTVAIADAEYAEFMKALD